MSIIEQFERLNAPAPIPTAISTPFWEAAAAETFILQKCNDCGAWVFYPRGHCPHCWGASLTWVPASGKGALHSFSAVHRPGHAAWKAAAPYVLGIVRLDEGPSMLSTITTEAHQKLHIDMPIEVRFVKVGQFTLPMFEPREVKGKNHEC